MENKQVEEMAECKKCETCIHNAVCQELEEYRDPLGWISTEGEFVCSYYDAGYRKASDVALEMVDEFIDLVTEYVKDKGLYLVAFKNAMKNAKAELKKKYTEG